MPIHTKHIHYLVIKDLEVWKSVLLAGVQSIIRKPCIKKFCQIFLPSRHNGVIFSKVDIFVGFMMANSGATCLPTAVGCLRVLRMVE